MSAAVNPQLWWYVARASGFVAWALAIAAILLGLSLATRALGSNPRPAWLLDLHRFVGGLMVAFLALHLGALVADSYVHFGVADLLVPFASDWKSGPVAWGIVGFWLLLAVEGSSLVMKRVPKRVWRGIHLTSYLAVVVSTIHAFTAGTDAGNPAFVWGSVVSLGATAFFVVYRLLLPKRRQRAAAKRASQPTRRSDPSDAERPRLPVTPS